MTPTTLGDVFAPWIFREGAYRELPLGGGGPTVFEARNLVVPAGSFGAAAGNAGWSYVLGQITIDPRWGGNFAYSIEFAEPVNLSRNRFDIYWSGRDEDGNDSGVAFMTPPQSGTLQWLQLSGLIVSIGYNVFPGDRPLPDQVDLTAALLVVPNAMTNDDVEIIHARTSMTLV